MSQICLVLFVVTGKKKQSISKNLKAECCSIEHTDARLWSKTLHSSLGLLKQSTKGKFSSSCYVGKLCQHIESGVLGHCFQQRHAGVSDWKCSLHRYLSNLTSLPQALQRGTSVHLGSVSTSVFLCASKIYAPYFWILIRTRCSPSCGFTALLLQMWVWAGAGLKGHQLCITSPRYSLEVCILLPAKHKGLRCRSFRFSPNPTLDFLDTHAIPDFSCCSYLGTNSHEKLFDALKRLSSFFGLHT